jgi:thiol-disulfide isomerase/thioredoxin
MGLRRAIFAALIFVAGCGSGDSYQIANDLYGPKIITGRFTPSVLESDSSFPWYNQNFASFTPDSASVSFLSKAAKDVHFVVVGGTWCGDTKRELPKFFKTVSLAHIPAANIELYGVDRSKKSKDGFTEKYNIVNVPTFILLSEGKEIGRIVESARKSIETDMVDILQKK